MYSRIWMTSKTRTVNRYERENQWRRSIIGWWLLKRGTIQNYTEGDKFHICEAKVLLCRQYYTVSSIGWTCQRGSPTSCPSWCTAACMVRHLGTSPTISPQPLTSLRGFVSVPRTDSNFSYLAVDLTRMAIELSSLLVQRYGIRYLTNSETRRVVHTVLNSSSRQSCSVSTNVTSALEVS